MIKESMLLCDVGRIDNYKGGNGFSRRGGEIREEY